jgi:alkylated DNA repair dioxygenase AlkB
MNHREKPGKKTAAHFLEAERVSTERTAMKSLDLADGGLLLYDEAFLPRELADRYFLDLRDHCAWDQKPALFGHMQPRLTASYGDPGVVYRYSGTENHALPWTDSMLEIKAKIEAVRGTFNYCLLNRYRSGSDSMGWHADDEPEMGPIIGSLSLGATREFRIRHNTTRETMVLPAGHGTLIIMAGTMQQFWKHDVPKTKEIVGERINLTFRRITSPATSR